MVTLLNIWHLVFLVESCVVDWWSATDWFPAVVYSNHISNFSPVTESGLVIDIHSQKHCAMNAIHFDWICHNSFLTISIIYVLAPNTELKWLIEGYYKSALLIHAALPFGYWSWLRYIIFGATLCNCFWLFILYRVLRRWKKAHILWAVWCFNRL